MTQKLQQIDEWFKESNEHAMGKLKSLDISAFMEVQAYLPNANIYIEGRDQLKEAARRSTIRTFGWPIGVFLDTKEFEPKPRNWGIRADISIANQDRNTYDYWAIRQDGGFFLLKSIFEDQRKQDYIFFDTRIIRIAETFMYLSGLYESLGVGKDQIISVAVKHGGLKGRTMGAAGNRLILENRISEENEVPGEVETSIEDISKQLPVLVEKITKPLFEMFDFFTVDSKIVEEIVDKYKRGIIS